VRRCGVAAAGERDFKIGDPSAGLCLPTFHQDAS
jgi:hypothetical protein